MSSTAVSRGAGPPDFAMHARPDARPPGGRRGVLALWRGRARVHRTRGVLRTSPDPPVVDPRHRRSATDRDSLLLSWSTTGKRVELDLTAKLAIYRHFAAVGARPSVDDIAARLGVASAAGSRDLRRLRAQRVLVLEADAESIRMAPPFSGVPTQHRVTADGVTYYANCAWDALGIPAALRRPAHRALPMRAIASSPSSSRFRAADPNRPTGCSIASCPASKWWDDIVFT